LSLVSSVSEQSSSFYARYFQELLEIKKLKFLNRSGKGYKCPKNG
jgi:hypothetical protein